MSALLNALTERTAMNKHWLISLGAGLMLCGTTYGEVSREVLRTRTNAINEMSFTLPCAFISKKDFLTATRFIKKELPDTVHQKLLELQARASELYEQREQMLMIAGITPEHPSVRQLDYQLIEVEKKFDNLLYNDGIFNWKSMLAVGVGTGVGLAAGTGHLIGMRGQKGWVRGLVVSLLAVLMLEYAMRGRRAVIAGNVWYGLRFVIGVVCKFLGAVLGNGGHLDKFAAKLERVFRSLGTRLDKVFGKKAATISITAIALAVVAITIVILVKQR
jgi:hypothetical protein